MASTHRELGVTVMIACRVLYILTVTSIGPLSLVGFVSYLLEDERTLRHYAMLHGVVVVAFAIALLALVALEAILYLRQPRERRDASARALAQTGRARVWCNALMTPVVLASALPVLLDLFAPGPTGGGAGVGFVMGIALLLTLGGTAAMVILMLTGITVDRALLASASQAEG